MTRGAGAAGARLGAETGNHGGRRKEPGGERRAGRGERCTETATCTATGDGERRTGDGSRRRQRVRQRGTGEGEGTTGYGRCRSPSAVLRSPSAVLRRPFAFAVYVAVFVHRLLTTALSRCPGTMPRDTPESGKRTARAQRTQGKEGDERGERCTETATYTATEDGERKTEDGRRGTEDGEGTTIHGGDAVLRLPFSVCRSPFSVDRSPLPYTLPSSCTDGLTERRRSPGGAQFAPATCPPWPAASASHRAGPAKPPPLAPAEPG